LLEYDDEVLRSTAQPLTITYYIKQQRRRYTPDVAVYFNQSINRKPWVVEIKYQADLIAYKAELENVGMSMRLFEPGTKLLPGFCKPYPNELLTSWLTRLPHNHGMGMRELYQHIWPDHGPRVDIDSCIDGEQIYRLALATNCTENEVSETTLLGYRNKLFTKTGTPGMESPNNLGLSLTLSRGISW
jgi:hypothetical protein